MQFSNNLKNEAFVKYKDAEYLSCYFGLVGIVCGVIEYEISYWDTENINKYRWITLLTIALFSTLCLLVSIVVRYFKQLTWLKRWGLVG